MGRPKKIDTNKGSNVDIFGLFGVDKGKPEETQIANPQPTEQQGEYPWGSEWLSIHNDEIFGGEW